MLARCDVVLPCLDEAAALPGVLAAIPADMRPIVVDNGSRDGSADIARAHGATVVEEPRPGSGAAVPAGVLPAASRPRGGPHAPRDGPADIAGAHGATVVEEPRPGYGAAVHAGVLAASAP